jgi:hypothetical protein
MHVLVNVPEDCTSIAAKRLKFNANSLPLLKLVRKVFVRRLGACLTVVGLLSEKLNLT